MGGLLNDPAVIVYAVTAGLLVMSVALLFAGPRPRRQDREVVLLTLPADRPQPERFDYPTGIEGAYAIHWEMRLWFDAIAGLDDLAAVTPQIEAAYLPVGVAR
ncbi:hypothetical protein MED01_002320 [Micromonospora sp. MED01]|uniref:hypothetical protein n=1 Tax=Micromonospora alfalfae TaxID=2911212 RepID=UPI001EE85168|nr:hypothetical protein [Micromonospora alfalfae]MCG5464155.1 hypothetical protein [Micromonospora alfalfae]